MKGIITNIKELSRGYGKVLIVTLLFHLTACEDFIQIDPPKTEITSETVFTSDAAATAAIRGIYSEMMTNSSYTKGDLELNTGLSADEFVNYSSSVEQLQFSLPALTATNSIVYNVFWTEAYKHILNANSMLEGLEKSVGLSDGVKNQLQGEAMFIRAFSHFYLVNLFGEIPYVTSTDYSLNAIAARDNLATVYQNIVADLIVAQNLMVADYSFSTERVQPNKGAATALLARVYLYLKEWEKAEEQATMLIENESLYTLETELNTVFLKSSKETIWQLKPVIPGTNTPQGLLFILNSIPENSLGKVSLMDSFYDSFEAGDQRKDYWVGIYMNGTDSYYYPFKYKIDYNSTVLEYSVVLRLGEQYLIRAEARAQLNNLSGAREDINAIRNRSGLAEVNSDDQALLLLAIEQERKMELFAEWGHRWLDLKRTQRTDQILGAIKSDWQSTDEIYPIPNSERLVNPNLNQNPGY